MLSKIKKILIVTPSLSIQKGGGIATSVINYYDAISKQKYIDITVVTTLSPDEKESEGKNEKDNKNIIFFEISSKKWRYSKALNQYLKNEIQNYDIVWVHGIWLSQAYFVCKYATKYDIPYIISPHGSLNPYAIKQKKIKKSIYLYLLGNRILRKATAIHCLTDFEKKSVQKISDSEIFVFPNIISVGVFKKKDYSKLNDICFIGRFDHKKGLDLLLEALSRTKKIRLLIAGDGEKTYKEYIYSIVKKYNLEKRVVFFGFADDIMKKKIFEQSLFCVLSSYSEGLAMVGLEAIAQSTPILATQQCDFEIIEEWDAGIVIESNEPRVIREGIQDMMDKDIEQMSINAHFLAKKYFDLEDAGKRLSNKLEMIINNIS